MSNNNEKKPRNRRDDDEPDDDTPVRETSSPLTTRDYPPPPPRDYPRASRPREGDLLNALADVARDEVRRAGGAPAWSRLLAILEPEPDIEPRPEAVMVPRDIAVSVGLDVAPGAPGVVLTFAEARSRGLM